ncbi:BSD domain-containing protein 1-like [Clytia hemisphaerica]|uniref:BSD domain-containing protein n=1 Tax=Clytia hemisphaerica TaxID=252671 RepID=A0A7M5VCR7_9CNID
MEEEDKSSSKKKNEDSSSDDQSNSWWGGWGQGWIDSVKEKSASTLEMVKKDLNEFVEVIQGDTSVAINETADKLDEHVQQKEENTTKEKDDSGDTMNTTELVTQGVKGLSKVLHSMSELMSIQEPDDSNEEFITLAEGSFSLQGYNRKQEKLHMLQTDPGTYCNEPEGSFNDWLEVFSLDEHKEDMSNLLTQNSAVRAVYSKLVPDVLSHTAFWQRYYFKVFELETEERKREELLERAKKSTTHDNGDESDDGGWGDDDDDIEVVSTSIAATSTKQETNKEEIQKTPIKDDKNITKNKTTPENITEPSALQMMSPPVQNMRDEPISSVEIPKLDLDEPKETHSFVVKDTKPVEMSKPVSEAPKETVIPVDLDTKSEPKAMEKSCETIKDDKELEVEENFDQINSVIPKKIKNNSDITRLTPELENTNKPSEISETASVSSWMSIDDQDNMKVKKIKGEQTIKSENSRPVSDGGSSNSSGVLINKSEADDLDDDDDFDIDLDEIDDVNDEELQKMVQNIKEKSANGGLEDEDDDWENWE